MKRGPGGARARYADRIQPISPRAVAYGRGMRAAGSQASFGAAPEGAGTSVLIVEDDASIAAQLAKGLTRGGYRVDHVLTGHDALQCGQRDVVLLDLELPDLDGVQVCRKLRERSDAAI